MTIAIDFDGTIVENRFPDIGPEKLFAFETMIALQKNGYRLILWTCREGQHLDRAVEFCQKKGVEFYAINKSYPEETFEPGMSRKVRADLFVDDRVVGGFPGWSEIWRKLKPADEYTLVYEPDFKPKNIFQRIFQSF